MVRACETMGNQQVTRKLMRLYSLSHDLAAEEIDDADIPTLRHRIGGLSSATRLCSNTTR
jgi:hypothetical protein